MNVPTIKLVCWLAALASLGGLAKYAYDWFGTLEERQLPIDPEYVKAVLNEDATPPVDVREIVDYKDLQRTFGKNMNWTGEPPPKPIDQGPAGPPPKAPPVPVDRILSVVMLRVDTVDPGGSIALVRYNKERLDATLSVGDALISPYEYAVVKSIKPGVITFSFTDVERDDEAIGPNAIPEELIHKVGAGGPILPNQPLVPKGTARDDARPEETRQTARGVYQLGTGDMETFANDYQRILTEDVITDTYMKDGKRAGVEIKSVKEGSIASKHGAVAGDVLISINGHKVTSESEAISYVKANSETTTAWEVVVLRYGKEETVMYYSK